MYDRKRVPVLLGSGVLTKSPRIMMFVWCTNNSVYRADTL